MSAARSDAVRRPCCGRRRSAFSLAELMIAVMLLGLGLLFIAAALPVGIDYTRRNLDAGDAQAAGQEALTLLRSRVRTSQNLVAPGVPVVTYHRADQIVRPRNADGTADNLYEPLIKVRPLVMANVLAEQDDNRQPGTAVLDPTEVLITAWYLAQGLATTSKEVDPPNPRLGLNPAPRFVLTGPLHAPLRDVPLAPIRPTERVFPFVRPLAADQIDPRILVRDPRRMIGYRPPDDSEWQAVLERRIAWTAFYRRVSYRRDPGRDGQFFTPDDVLQSDPLRYEFIVVVTRRPTPRHRFAVQRFDRNNIRDFREPEAAAPGAFVANGPYGSATVAPVPWLVVLTKIEPELKRRQDYDFYIPPAPGPQLRQRVAERYLTDSFRDTPPARLTFRCKPQVGQLLPPGSILIPARNDWAPNLLNAGAGFPGQPPRADYGFVPGAPDALPIYRVIERPDLRTLVVENNGYYPWNRLDRWNEQVAAGMPFWVIPPAFVSRDANGQPIFEQTSPILAVVRQVVTLPELPAEVFGLSAAGGGAGGAGGRVP